MAGQFDVEKIERAINQVFELEPNMIELYLITDSLMRILMTNVTQKDQINVLRALIVTAVLNYFNVQGREDIGFSKASNVVEDLIKTISAW